MQPPMHMACAPGLPTQLAHADTACTRRHGSPPRLQARRQQRGLVSSEELLLDFEQRRQDILERREFVQQLQAKHAALLTYAAQSKRRAQATGVA